MPYRRVTKPIPFPRAFGATSDAAILSQAAILLLMEPTLRRNRTMLAEYQSARRTLKVPSISARGRRVKVEEVESPLRLPSAPARQSGRGPHLFWTHVGTQPPHRHLGRLHAERRRSCPSRCGHRIGAIGTGEPASRRVKQKDDSGDRRPFNSHVTACSWYMGR